MINKKEKKIYNKQLRRTRKELCKLAKEFRPYDSLWCIELLIGSIKGVRDYYANNVLVYAEDPQDMPSRLEMCNEILEAYEEWVCLTGWEEEDEVYARMWSLIAAYMPFLWD